MGHEQTERSKSYRRRRRRRAAKSHDKLMAVLKIVVNVCSSEALDLPHSCRRGVCTELSVRDPATHTELQGVVSLARRSSSSVQTRAMAPYPYFNRNTCKASGPT
eukprot:jgi/Mesen1/11022/ME000098S10420